MKTLAIVIATKDRPNELQRLLFNLKEQSRRPDAVVIVDASPMPNAGLGAFRGGFPLTYIHHPFPSAAEQRNVGIRTLHPDTSVVGILDDDVALADGALEAVAHFWEDAPTDVAGCGCNWLNFTPTPGRILKESRLFEWLGIYSRVKGRVTPSGWHTLIGTVDKDLWVEWLPIGASFWRKAIFDTFSFDPFFTGYSYLEDLDFTYSVSRKRRLVALERAGFEHHHSETARIDLFRFGRIEVRNRLYFVKKHGLSLGRCHLGLFVRMLMTLYFFAAKRDRRDLQRAMGNLATFGETIFRRRQSRSLFSNAGEDSNHAR